NNICGSKGNTHVGQLLADFLDVDPGSITPLLAHQQTEQIGFGGKAADLKSG
ncbi:hypothetical protein GGI00_000907, partial [Coemansia sp. RSA 2681]